MNGMKLRAKNKISKKIETRRKNKIEKGMKESNEKI